MPCRCAIAPGAINWLQKRVPVSFWLSGEVHVCRLVSCTVFLSRSPWQQWLQLTRQGMGGSYLKIATPERTGLSDFKSPGQHWLQLRRQCRENCHKVATPAIAGAL